MEDVVVLAGLFDVLVTNPSEISRDKIEAVFAAFDANRRERDLWLVQSSRYMADVYQRRVPELGLDRLVELRDEIVRRQDICWNFDLKASVEEARRDLKERLA